MTPKCLDTSRDLQEFFKSSFCDSVTTEVILHAWISLNDAIDIRSMLWSMAHDPEKMYGEDVSKKLAEMIIMQKQETSVGSDKIQYILVKQYDGSDSKLHEVVTLTNGGEYCPERSLRGYTKEEIENNDCWRKI